MFKNEKGFTLIEMLIVLLIISVLLIITIPNVSNNNSMVRDKGCEALVKLAEAQVQSYYIANSELPSDVSALVGGEYLTESQTKCPNGETLEVVNGKVTTTAGS
ncbi:competence protein ComGC [Thalassobacillus devorans]|uniref:ComG operon protein 3 n=1 Tax=Thalassobacillus devorans TaxID=279813 RepID=A0ABQ1P9N8_9BACI|nr:competence type IV pilus major pilin ComGC [Thalassobacillus devorans]NIK29627.1 competence protein ComGC [Thalassobacillus devorans]GGC91603.1 competence protein ComGC [Thalassobacillus devorans]